MPYINFSRMERVLTRAGDLAAGPNANAAVVRLYNDTVRGPASAFAASMLSLRRAEEACRKEVGEAVTAVLALTPHYNSARSVASAYLQHLEMPDTLGALSTDTDKVHAIEALHDEIEAHRDAPWAADLLTGPFGTNAPQAVHALHEAENANVLLAKARAERGIAYNTVYAVYVPFKRVVRDTYGSTSREYHRIHLRSVAKEESAASSAGGAAPAAGGAPTSTAPQG